MEPSEEVRQVVTRFFQALRDGDEDAIVSRISRDPGFERLGSDQTERWHDGDAARLVWPQQVREMGGYPWKLIDDVRAMSEGSVGWATARTELEAPEGPFEMRFTCVPHLEHGEWRLVQWHSSVPVSNEQMGWFLTTTVDQIAQDISEARPDLSVTSAPDGTVTIVFTDIEDSPAERVSATGAGWRSLRPTTSSSRALSRTTAASWSRTRATASCWRSPRRDGR